MFYAQSTSAVISGQSSHGKPGGSAALESFSNAPFVIPGVFKVAEGLLCSSTSGEQCGTSTSSPAPSASTLCGSLQSTRAAPRRDADDCRGKISSLQSQVTVLTEERRASCKELEITSNANVSLVQEIVHEKKVSVQLQQVRDLVKGRWKEDCTEVSCIYSQNISCTDIVTI